MPLSDLIERLGRTIFEAPFSGAQLSTDQPELAEIRLALLDEIKSKSHRVAGRYVFPHNLVRVQLLGVPEAQSTAFAGDFFPTYFQQELTSGLTRANYRFPADLRVELRTTPRMPAPRETWIQVETETLAPAATEPLPQTRRPAKLVVMRGTASHPEIILKKTRTNIGRTVEVTRLDGPSRRNDLAFTEDNEINRTVSREHAHIIHHKTAGEYRLYNDRWYKAAGKPKDNCGLWIIRDGLSQEVHRNPRGAKLQHGDEIQLGQAMLKFTVR
jgi:pSer/pThr/pTyr-binding forkhead associated (FHA) protein